MSLARKRKAYFNVPPPDPETALLGQLPVWLQELGLALKQKRHYKAGKLTSTRNWCQLFDDGIVPHLTAADSKGRLKTWKLFARFSDRQPPAWPWDRPRLEAGSGTMMGRDVWGIAVEDVREC